jgi:hypothetical protein
VVVEKVTKSKTKTKINPLTNTIRREKKGKGRGEFQLFCCGFKAIYTDR